MIRKSHNKLYLLIKSMFYYVLIDTKTTTAYIGVVQTMALGFNAYS